MVSALLSSSVKISQSEDEPSSSSLSKPLKRRGLSKYYSGRSQSFSSMELVLMSSLGDDSKALSKIERGIAQRSTSLEQSSHRRVESYTSYEDVAPPCLWPYREHSRADDIACVLSSLHLQTEETSWACTAACSLDSSQHSSPAFNEGRVPAVHFHYQTFS